MLCDMAYHLAMNTEFIEGQEVMVVAYGGERLRRRVVRDLGATIVICNEQEFHKSREENRAPEGVGFPRKDVLGL